MVAKNNKKERKRADRVVATLLDQMDNAFSNI